MNFSLVDDDEAPTNTADESTRSIVDAAQNEAPNRASDTPESVVPTEVRLPVLDDDRTARSVDGPAETLNQTELARLYNLSRNVVIERIEEAGIVPVQRGGRTGTRYLVTPELTELLTHKYNGTDRKLEATERKLEAEAELKEIQVQERRGELIAVSEIELGSVQFFRTLYNSLMTYFADSALEISRLRTRGEVEHYQKTHGGQLLQNLREDPNNALTRYNRQDEVSQ